MSTIKLCQKYFGKKDIYELFEVDKNATIKDIKKAYYKLSLQVHPDRVPVEEKEEATEKFKVLSKIYQVLLDKNKRDLYNEQGIINDDDEFESKLINWIELWRQIFKPISMDAIKDYERSYIGSEMERTDMKKAYLSGKGCINHIMDYVPFLKVEDEPRLHKIIGEMIAAGEVPEYKAFTDEPKRKRYQRHRKYAYEEKCANRQKKKMEESNNDLAKAIMAKNEERMSNSDNFFDLLAKKYGGEDDSTPIDIRDLGKSKKKTSTSTASSEKKLHDTRNGKVTKRKI